MKRTVALLAGTAALVSIAMPASAYTRPRPAPHPAAVSITGTEVCSNGWITVSGTLTTTVAGTFDIVFTGDLASYRSEQYVDTFTLTAGESAAHQFGLGSGQQVDVIVYDDLTGARVADRQVAAASVCVHSW